MGSNRISLTSSHGNREHRVSLSSSQGTRENREHREHREKKENRTGTSSDGLTLINFSPEQEKIVKREWGKMKRILTSLYKEIYEAYYETGKFKSKKFSIFGEVWGYEKNGFPKCPMEKPYNPVRIVFDVIDKMQKKVEAGITIYYDDAVKAQFLRICRNCRGAYTDGKTIYIIRNLWEEDRKFAILAHELSHIAASTIDDDFKDPKRHVTTDAYVYTMLFEMNGED